MQINSVVNYQIMQRQQNFKGSSANSVSNPLPSAPTCSPIPLETSKAYASPQITEGYKEIETFDVPYIGKGHLYQLANGHKIILIPKMGQTLIHTYVGAGEVNEPIDTKETSHLLEHLIADYCSNPKDIETKEFLSKTGAEANAHTSNDFTGYHIKAALEDNNNFEDLIKTQANTLQNTGFTDKDIEQEKNIVIQELESRGKFVADYMLAERLANQNLFSLNDSDAAITPSNVETIKNIKKEDLINYYNTFYRTDNMVTTIIGPVDENSIKTIAKHFNNIQPPKPANNVNYPIISTDNLIQKTVRKDVQSLDKESQQAYIDLAFLGPKNNDYKDNVLANALEWAIDNRIKKIAYKNEDNIDMNSNLSRISSDKKMRSVLRVHGACSDDEVEDKLKLIYSALYDLAQNPISEDELNALKYNYKSDFTNIAEDSFILSMITCEAGMFSHNPDISKEFNIVDKLNAQDIQNTAKKYLDLNKASLVVIHPQEKAKDVEAKGEVNSVSFKGVQNDLHMEDVHEYLLPNNLRVVIDSRPGIARTTIKLDLNSQKMIYCNPEAGWFLASKLVSKQTKDKMEIQGIKLDSDGNPQHIYAMLNGSTDKTMEMLTSAIGMLLHPDLNAEDFNKTKNKLIDNDFDGIKDHTIGTANEEFFKGNPYFYHPGSMKSLDLEDVKNLHQQILKNAQGTVFITIPKEELDKNKNEIFQTLMQMPTLQPYDYDAIFNKYKPLPLEKTKVYIKENDSNQIEIAKHFKIIESGNIQDRAGLLILNSLLGGDEEARLFDKLRNKDNIAYSAYSFFDTDFTPGLAKISLSTAVSADNKDNLHTVISEFDNSINELTSKPVSQEELNMAKHKVKSSTIRDLETSSNRNESVSQGYNSYYGTNYQQALFDAINNMTPEYIQQLAKYYLTQPSIISISGNKEAIEANKAYLSSIGDLS